MSLPINGSTSQHQEELRQTEALLFPGWSDSQKFKEGLIDEHGGAPTPVNSTSLEVNQSASSQAKQSAPTHATLSINQQSISSNGWFTSSPGDFPPNKPTDFEHLHSVPTDHSPPSSPHRPFGQPLDRDPDAYSPYPTLPTLNNLQFTHAVSNDKPVSSNKPSNESESNRPSNNTERAKRRKEQIEQEEAKQLLDEAAHTRTERINNLIEKYAPLLSLSASEADKLPPDDYKDWWSLTHGGEPIDKLIERKLKEEGELIANEYKRLYHKRQDAGQQTTPSELFKEATQAVFKKRSTSSTSSGSPQGKEYQPELSENRRTGPNFKARNPPSLLNNKFAETSTSRKAKERPQEPINPTAMFHIKTPAANSPPKVAIIGGTGLDQDSSLFKEMRLVDLPDTPYGQPSDNQVVEGRIGNTTVVLLARHGKDHTVNPSNVNYRANIWALKQIGCHIVLATTACGSLVLGIPPGHLVVLDQYIDRTKGNRESSFYKVAHIPQGEPFDEEVRRCMVKACHDLGYEHNPTGTCVTIEGPRFSTKAESNLYRSWGASVVNMTTVPEAPLVAELGMHYAALALVTDYDCWHDNPEESVSVELVGARMRSIREKAHMVLIETIKRIEQIDWQIPHARKMRVANQAVMAK